MSKVHEVRSSGGIGFLGALFLVFLVLKLTNVINWSWWWVTAPLWMPLALLAFIVFLAFVIVFLAIICRETIVKMEG